MPDITARAQAIVRREAEAVSALAEQFDDSLSTVLSILFNCTGHVLVAGMGTSGALAQRLAHQLSSSGTPALAISPADGLHGGSGAVTEKDVVYLISRGGRSDEINQFAAIARSRGARIVAQTEDPESPLAKLCDTLYLVKVKDDADPFGIVATGSSLVSGAAADILCELLLEMRGFSPESFGRTHPAGAVGKRLAAGGP
jgi:arabinose-5-phosphate isomerase